MSKAKIVKGEIVFKLRVKDLPMIVESGPNGQFFKVNDANKFAKEVVRVLNGEDEDGTTPIHRMFDKATCAAYDAGAEGAEDLFAIEHLDDLGYHWRQNQNNPNNSKRKKKTKK